MNKKIKTILKKPALIFLSLGQRGWFNWMSDKLYLKIAYRIRMGKPLNMEKPATYNEKLQWIKLNIRPRLWTMLVDKYEVKNWVAETIGSEYVIPTLGVFEKFEDIDFAKLPEQFVLKCTHNSGGIVICKDKSKLDLKSAKSILETSLKQNFFYGQREWPYKNVRPRIIAEQYMEDSVSEDLRDYKFFCFDGKVNALFIATERMNKDEETKFDFFDADFNHLPFTNGHPNAIVPPVKPSQFNLMKELSAKLSKEIPQVRVDFYEVNGKVYFGEMTFFHWSGMVPFVPEEWDYKFGEWIKLPK